MPELPEVETVRRGLVPAMVGARFSRVTLRRSNLRFPFPENFAGRLEGRTVTELGRRAKYLTAHLDSGETLVMHVDWPRRYKLMRMHTACHLLSVVCPFPITGAAVGEDESRVDFAMTETIDRDTVTTDLMRLVSENHPIYLQWITDEELAANPGIVKSKNVRPPVGMGRVSLVCIGEDSAVDSQPCGGTHVSETQEVGAIHIAKIEKKGKENRRLRIRFGTPDALA